MKQNKIKFRLPIEIFLLSVFILCGMAYFNLGSILIFKPMVFLAFFGMFLCGLQKFVLDVDSKEIQKWKKNGV